MILTTENIFAMSKWWMSRKIEKLQMRIAWLLPRSVLRWALVRCAVSVPDSEAYPGEVTYTQMYKAI